jgi:hypothetical protein
MEVSGQLHAPAALPPEERASGTNWIGGWVVPRASLDAVEKNLALPVIEVETPSPYLEFYGGVLQSTPLPALASQHTICWMYLNVSLQIANKLGK